MVKLVSILTIIIKKLKLMKIFGTVFLTILFATFQLKAQDAAGLQLLNYEKFNDASLVFAKNAENVSIFYQGYSLMRAGKIGMANTIFSKIATTPLGIVGAGWVELNKNNAAGAKILFENALKASKNKDGLVYRFIGEAYTESVGVKDYAQAIEKLKAANNLIKNNAAISIALGEAYLAAQDGGNAVVQFEYAAKYDPSTALPNCKIGSVYYLSRNYPLAIEYLNKAIAIDSKNPVIYRELGKIYYKQKKYDLAKEQFSKYATIGEMDVEDKTLYANILFLGKDYPAAIEIINEIIKTDNSKNYLNRLIGYSYYETEKYLDAQIFMEKFFATQPKEKIIASDYEYYGKSLMKNGKDSIGILNFIKAAEMDTTNKEPWGSVAEAYFKLKKYNEAAIYYTKKIDSDAPSASDWFNVGNSYYRAKNFIQAKAAFYKVVEIKPEAATGHLWCSKALLGMDPEQKTSSAKPFYEKYIEIASLNPEKNKRDLVDAYNYMSADAYNNKGDIPLAKEFAQKVLSLDPSNEQAKSVMSIK